MTHLVIGQNSFIGQHLKQHQDAAECRFISHGSALDEQTWDQPYDSVLNLALDPAVKNGASSDFDLQIGLKAQENGAHFIAMSSRKVYGSNDDETHYEFHEQHPWLKNRKPYGQSKRLMERNLQEKLDLTKLTILRPSNIFGFEYNPDNPRKSFFSQMLQSLKENGVIYFDMSGDSKRDFIDIDNFINILMTIIKDPKQDVYNIGSGIPLSSIDIADWVIEGYGEGRVDILNDTPINDSFHLNVELLQSHYDVYVPTIDDIKSKCIEIGQKLRDL